MKTSSFLIVSEREEKNTEKEKKNPAVKPGSPTRVTLHHRDLTNLLCGGKKKEL